MKTRNLFWGLLLLGIGCLLLLYAFGLGDNYHIIRIIASILLLAVAISSLAQFKFVLFFFPLALILYLWRAQLGLTEINIAPLFGSAALLGIGLSVLFRKKHFFPDKSGAECQFNSTIETLNDNEFVSVDSSLGDNIKYIHASNLKKVQIKSSFSSTKVYFDQCQISSEGVEINVNGSFTEIVLNVPRGWQIENQVSAFAGTVTNVAPVAAGVTPNIKLTGNINFAELKVIYI